MNFPESTLSSERLSCARIVRGQFAISTPLINQSANMLFNIRCESAIHVRSPAWRPIKLIIVHSFAMDGVESSSTVYCGVLCISIQCSHFAQGTNQMKRSAGISTEYWSLLLMESQQCRHTPYTQKSVNKDKTLNIYSLIGRSSSRILN
jgi:hypothetical protein